MTGGGGDRDRGDGVTGAEGQGRASSSGRPYVGPRGKAGLGFVTCGHGGGF